MFEPIAVETLSVFNASAIRLLNDLGRRISSISGDTRETSHLYQRVSVLVQRFNAVLLHDSLPVADCTDCTDTGVGSDLHRRIVWRCQERGL